MPYYFQEQLKKEHSLLFKNFPFSKSQTRYCKNELISTINFLILRLHRKSSKMKAAIALCSSFLLLCCSGIVIHNSDAIVNSSIINPEGNTIETRITVPEGFVRIIADSLSFTSYLRNLALKPDGATVKLYSGEDKGWQHVHVAVVDMEIGTKDLQQCADACIRLRAEYLWKTKHYDAIHFNLTNGFRMDYSRWRDGYRLKVDGNKTWWEKSAEASSNYKTFRAYLDRVFMFAGTLSIANELKQVDMNDIQPGDVFVQGGSPGHAVIAVDIAVNNSTQEKIFMLAQSYMPAQEIHIIKNPNDESLSPWYSNQFEGSLETMEWTFPAMVLRRFE